MCCAAAALLFLMKRKIDEDKPRPHTVHLRGKVLGAHGRIRLLSLRQDGHDVLWQREIQNRQRYGREERAMRAALLALEAPEHACQERHRARAGMGGNRTL